MKYIKLVVNTKKYTYIRCYVDYCHKWKFVGGDKNGQMLDDYDPYVGSTCNSLEIGKSTNYSLGERVDYKVTKISNTEMMQTDIARNKKDKLVRIVTKQANGKIW